MDVPGLNKNAIEIISSGATHGYLPLLGKEETVNAQLKAGQAIFQKHFGREHSKGIWLPELAYRPGYKWKNPITGEEIEREGVDLVVMASHGSQGNYRFGSVTEKVLKNSPAPVTTIPIDPE